MEILVFKTNVPDQKHFPAFSPQLESLQGVKRWTIDLEDIDKVLRIESDGISPYHVESAMNFAGYECAELPD